MFHFCGCAWIKISLLIAHGPHACLGCIALKLLLHGPLPCLISLSDRDETPELVRLLVLLLRLLSLFPFFFPLSHIQHTQPTNLSPSGDHFIPTLTSSHSLGRNHSLSPILINKYTFSIPSLYLSFTRSPQSHAPTTTNVQLHSQPHLLPVLSSLLNLIKPPPTTKRRRRKSISPLFPFWNFPSQPAFLNALIHKGKIFFFYPLHQLSLSVFLSSALICPADKGCVSLHHLPIPRNTHHPTGSNIQRSDECILLQ